MLVAQHPENRGGIAITSLRADELLKQVLQHFDHEDASYGAVAVEERPGQTLIRDYNKEKISGDTALAAVTEGTMIPWESIGASHINQVLRNIIGGATSQT